MWPRTRNELLFYERRNGAYIEVSNFELIPGIIPVVICFTNELCDPTGRLLYTRRSLRDCAFFSERSQLLLTPRNSMGGRRHLARQILIPEFVYKGVGIHFQSPTLDLLPLQLRIPDCQPAIAFDLGHPAQTNQISPADASVPASRRRRESAESGRRVQSSNHSPCARTSPKWKRAECFVYQSARQNNALLGKSESKAQLAENRESYRQLTYRLTFNILLEARRVSMAVGVRTWLGSRE